MTENNYIHRPLPVFAMQYNGRNATALRRNFNMGVEDSSIHKNLTNEIYVVFHNNVHREEVVRVSDYIIRDHTGAISVMNQKEFEEGYERK